MPLVPATLASDLEIQWLVPEGGEHPSSPAQSGNTFAGVVSNWFALAMAAGFPCATAAARRAQLAAAATAALQAGSASLAGMQLAQGVAGYLAGQVFGAGVASFPAAVAIGQSAITGAFSNLELPAAVRANQIAGGVYGMVVSTMVVFPPVISPPVPVM